MTTTLKKTLGMVLDDANPNTFPDALRKMKLGTMLTPIKVVATALTAAAAFDITTAAFLAKCTVTGISLPNNDYVTLPPIRRCSSVLVTAGAQAGVRVVAPAEATPIAPLNSTGTPTSVGVCTLSDDGKTLTFETSAAVTAFEFWYEPAPLNSLTTTYYPQSS